MAIEYIMSKEAVYEYEVLATIRCIKKIPDRRYKSGFRERRVISELSDLLNDNRIHEMRNETLVMDKHKGLVRNIVIVNIQLKTINKIMGAKS
jgi:hypothetical protein